MVCCQHCEQGYYTAYRHMLADDLDLIVHVFDYIYETNSPTLVRNHDLPVAFTLDDYRACHALYAKLMDNIRISALPNASSSANASAGTTDLKEKR